MADGRRAHVSLVLVRTETWQIGKRLKKLMETYPSMATQKTIDAFFLWGTALARLASLNEDPTLAEAAVDKFQEMAAISKGDDSAMGPVGYSLWASSLLIIATETRRKDVLDQALDKFQVRVIGALQQCHGVSECFVLQCSSPRLFLL